VKAISEGKVAATGMQFPKVMAETAAQFADEYVKGRRDFPQKIPVAVELVTGSNIQDYIAYGKK
jgi:ribose transport system substrate-binding protein